MLTYLKQICQFLVQSLLIVPIYPIIFQFLAIHGFDNKVILVNKKAKLEMNRIQKYSKLNANLMFPDIDKTNIRILYTNICSLKKTYTIFMT